MYGLPDILVVGVAKRIANAKFLQPPRGGAQAGTSFSFKFKGLIIYKTELDRMLNSPQGEVGRHLRKKALFIQTSARAQVGKKTGKLMRSIRTIHSRDSLGQYVKIGSSLSYALAHHEGTKPHIITPNDANILRFSAGGRVIYTHKVNHPGTRPNKYLSDQLWVVGV